MPGLASVVAAILLVLLRWGEEDEGSLAVPLAFVGGALAAVLVLGGALRRRARVRALSPRSLLLLRIAPLGGHALAIHSFHWLRVVEAIGLAEVASIGTLAALVPFLLLQGVVWARVWALGGSPGVPVREALGFHYRSAALGIVPFVLYAGAFDLLEAWRPAAVVLESWTLGASVTALALFVLLALAFPFVARGIWRTRALERGALRDALEGIARRLGFRGRGILVWETGGLAANAAIVGLLPSARYVVLTDGLLRLLGPREIEAVFGHEIGHARSRHAAGLFAYAGAWLLVVALLGRHLPPLSVARTAIASGIGFLAFWLGFGWLARRFELEADLFGAAAVGDAGIFNEALERVGGVSGRGRWHGSWRHFSVARRVAFLERVAADPAAGVALRARVRRVVRACAAVAIAAGAVHLVEFAARTPAEVGVAALRLGRFEAASRWLARTAPLEVEAEPFFALARIGESLEADSALRPLVREAAEILARGDREAMVGFLAGAGSALLDAAGIERRLLDPSGG